MINEQVNMLWLETNLPQAVIAAKVGLTPSALSRYILATFTAEQRSQRHARMQASAQSVKRVPTPEWYTGEGKSIPVRTVRYCEEYGITQLPPGTTVVMVDGDNNNFSPHNMILMHSKEAKKLAELRSIQAALTSEEETSGIQY